MRRPALAVLAALALATLVLAGCGGQPPRPVEEPAQPAPGSAPPAPRKPVVSKRGGAYYKDDGPADVIPDNLDSIPDAQPRPEPLHRFANRPYVVLGKSYVPDTRLRPFRQRGVASWYGKKFNGQPTSIGEPYDMFAMTAAHPTLAIPSYVRVTRVGTNRSVIVRVTDRGPFHADRIIDLSYAAAHRLGYVDDGSTLVEVEAILPEGPGTLASIAPPRPPAAPATPAAAPAPAQPDAIAELAARHAEEPTPQAAPGIYLQLGAFASADNAQALRGRLARDLDWVAEPIGISSGNGMHRVQLGPYAARGEAEAVAEKIRQALGYRPTIVSR